MAGLVPNLSLNYNSQAGIGIAGLGWTLEGASAITRCPQTRATDGAYGAVNLNTADRFCLDGQRLILVSLTAVLEPLDVRRKRASSLSA